jgi:phosphohistidine phosphatase SixA
MGKVEAERKSITDDCKDNLLLISSAVTAPARRAQQTFWILQPVFF